MEVIAKGILFGLILAMAIGPVFFSLIQNSIERGFIAGFFTAVGISISDIIYVILSYFGISKLAENPNFTFYVGLMGGLILIIFGAFSIFKKRDNPKQDNPQYRQLNGGNSLLRQVLKGFIINGINPFVFIFWIGTMSLATVEYGYSQFQIKVFFLAVLLTVFITDIIKSYLADKLSHFLNFKIMLVMNRSVGILLIVFGVRLIYLAMTDNQDLLIP